MIEFAIQLIGKLGYLGVALLMLIETLVPPIPSEVIMPLVGAAAANGELDLMAATFAAVVGATGGATIWYLAARSFGRERLRALADRHGRWLGLTGAMIERPTRWFARHGGWTIFLARILPGMRVYISIPAGLAGMSFPRFLAFTAAGYTVWYGLLGVVGHALSLNAVFVAEHLADAAPWLWAGLAAFVAWRIAAAWRGAKAPA